MDISDTTILYESIIKTSLFPLKPQRRPDSNPEQDPERDDPELDPDL